MGKFNLAEMLGGAVSGSDTVMEVRQIPLALIDDHDKNSYSMRGIEDLAESISIIGLKQPLVVREMGGRYLLLVGHRRKAALLQLGKETAPCTVMPEGLDPAKETLILHWTNTQQRGSLGGYEAQKAAGAIEEALADLVKRGEIELHGKMREYIAEVMHSSESKLARLKAIDNHLNKAWAEKFRHDGLPESSAYALSQCDEECQKKLYKVFEAFYMKPTEKDIKAAQKAAAYDWAKISCPYASDPAHDPIICTGADKRAAGVKRGNCLGCCKDCEKAGSCNMVCGQRSTRDRKVKETEENAHAQNRAHAEFFASPAGKVATRLIKTLTERGIDGTADVGKVSRYAISQILNCGSVYGMPRVGEAFDLADALEVPIDELLGLQSAAPVIGWQSRKFAEKPEEDQLVLAAGLTNGGWLYREAIYRGGKFFRTEPAAADIELPGSYNYWMPLQHP